MSNALSTFMPNAKLATTVDDAKLAQALTTSINDAGGAGGAGVNYLDFSGKAGVYKLGKNKTDIDEDTLFLVEPAATMAGWTCWKDGNVADDRKAKHKWMVTDALMNPEIVIQQHQLDDHGPYKKDGDGWKKMRGVALLALDKLDVSIEFCSTAISAIYGMNDLLQEASDRLLAGEPSMPIIWLGKEQFTAQGSTNWKPTFNVEIWVTRDAVAAFSEDELSEDQLLAGDAPKKKRVARKKK
jgi:hypothetical protein